MQTCSWSPAHLLSQLAPPQVFFSPTFFVAPRQVFFFSFLLAPRQVFFTPHRSNCLLNHFVGIAEIIIILFQCSCVQLCPSCRLPHQVRVFHYHHSALCKKHTIAIIIDIRKKSSSSSSLSSRGCLPRITMMFSDSPTQRSQL